MARATAYLNPEAEAHLRLYDASTYGIALPLDVAKKLIDAGCVEWRPGPTWGGTIYGLTEAGALILAELERLDRAAPPPTKPRTDAPVGGDRHAD